MLPAASFPDEGEDSGLQVHRVCLKIVIFLTNHASSCNSLYYTKQHICKWVTSSCLPTPRVWCMVRGLAVSPQEGSWEPALCLGPNSWRHGVPSVIHPWVQWIVMIPLSCSWVLLCWRTNWGYKIMTLSSSHHEKFCRLSLVNAVIFLSWIKCQA